MFADTKHKMINNNSMTPNPSQEAIIYHFAIMIVISEFTLDVHTLTSVKGQEYSVTFHLEAYDDDRMFAFYTNFSIAQRKR